MTQNIREITGLSKCTDERCFLHKKGYIKECKKFTFKSTEKLQTWDYNRNFNCNSKNVIYMLICTKCDANYIGQSQDLRDRTNNAKSQVRHYQEHKTLRYAKHFAICSNLKEPFFYCYPFYYEDDCMQRLFKEWRMIKRFKPTLNDKL